MVSCCIVSNLTEFISYRLDSEPKTVNAFTESWTDLTFYAFPPFMCLPRVIQKIWQDRARGILVVSNWPYQLWYSQFCNMITKDILPPRYSPSETRSPHITNKPKYQPPIALDFTIKISNGLREAAKTTQNSERVQDVISASSAPKTHANYNSYIRKWLKYCSMEGISDPYMAAYDRAMPFLSNMFYE